MLARLADPTFSARVNIRGTETVPQGIVPDPSIEIIPIDPGDALVLEYEGEAWLSGADYLIRMQVVDRSVAVWEELRVDGEVWRRWMDVHPWQQMPDPVDAKRPKLFALLAGLAALDSAAPTVSADGTRITYDAPADIALTLETLFHQEEAVKQPDVGSITLEATADGVPIRVLVQLSSDDLDYSEFDPGFAIPRRIYEFEYTFELDEAVSLPDPYAATEPFVSQFGLTLDYPAGWTIDREDEDFAEWTVSDGETVRAMTSPAPAGAPSEPDELLLALTTWAVDDWASEGAEEETLESTEVAGLPAYIVALRFPADGDSAFHLEAMFVSDRNMYILNWHCPPGTELSDRYEFERLLSTVRLVRR